MFSELRQFIIEHIPFLFDHIFKLKIFQVFSLMILFNEYRVTFWRDPGNISMYGTCNKIITCSDAELMSVCLQRCQARQVQWLTKKFRVF